MRRKSLNLRGKKSAKKSRSNRRVRSKRKTISKPRPRRLRLSVLKTSRQISTYQRALAVVARMRREKLSLYKASRIERIKSATVLRYVGNAVHRSGHGKPWKPTKSDRLGATMTVLTAQGPMFVVVKGSTERTRLARYDIALRKWRAGEDGAEKELLVFQGQTVGGQVLITDPDLLIQLEEAGQLDFDTLYFSVGGGS
jgi:hypothetical protein